MRESAQIYDVRMAQFVLKIEKLSHIMVPRGSQYLRSPSPIMAPGKNPLLDAQIVIPCGHSFCGFCVEEMKESTRASSCQLSRQTVNAIYPNRKANSMLSTLEG